VQSGEKIETTKLKFIPPGQHPSNIIPAAECDGRFRSLLIRNPDSGIT